MEVRMYPNMRRPNVGMKPKREAQRPLLPQHARHCPVLEAGSAIGFMVYPPIAPNESYHLEYQGDGRYRFIYYVRNKTGGWDALFAVVMTLPLGGSGKANEEVVFLTSVPATSRENALLIARTCMVPQDTGTPAGALALRGATNFATPAGWDTVYSPIFNQIERPVAPMLIVRVETDWYAHETEFRYVLQPGEGISGEHTVPIGQVFFIPREEITLRECTDEEMAALRQSMEAFAEEKAKVQLTTPYGLTYSPHYLRRSRSQKP